MTTIDPKLIEKAESYFPRGVNYLAAGHPLQSLVYHDYCYASDVKQLYNILIEDVIPTCCITRMNLLRLKMDLLICTRICFENKHPDRGEGIEKKLIAFLSRHEVGFTGTFLGGIRDFLEDFFALESSGIGHTHHKIVLGLGIFVSMISGDMFYEDEKFIFELRELLMETYHACPVSEKKRFLSGIVPRNVGTEHIPNQTDWVLGWAYPDAYGETSRHHYDREFATNRPNMRQFICVEDPRKPFFVTDTAEISLDEVANELYPYLERAADVLPTVFYQIFCMTGLANEFVFTEHGFMSPTRSEEFGIPENCRNLPEDFLLKEKLDLVHVNEEQVNSLLRIIEDLAVPLQKRGESPPKDTPPDLPRKRKRSISPSPAPERKYPQYASPAAKSAYVKKPKVYTVSDKPAVLHEFRTEPQPQQDFRPTRGGPPLIKGGSPSGLVVGGLIIALLAFSANS